MWLPTPTDADVEAFRELLRSTHAVECDNVEARTALSNLLKIYLAKSYAVRHLL